jgi:hypothetical protein
MAIKNLVVVLQVINTDVTCAANKKLNEVKISQALMITCFTDIKQIFNRK